MADMTQTNGAVERGSRKTRMGRVYIGATHEEAEAKFAPVLERAPDKERARAEAFYGGFLGLPLCARYDENGMKMAFFTLGNHHDFAVSEVAPDPSGAAHAGPGLDHVAFKSGDSLDQLREAKAKLDAAGIEIRPMDHEVTKSLYFHDPDGIEVQVSGS